MFRGFLLAGLALGGCTSGPAGSNPGPDTDTDTGSVAALSASCTLSADNALRAWCAVDTDPAGEVEVRFVPEDGGDERRHGSDGSMGHHEIGLYFMTAETSYRWTAQRVDDPSIQTTGVFTTGALPPEARENWDVSGASSADGYAHVGVCSDAPMGMVTRASDGATLWYQRFPDADRFVGLEVTEDDTVLGLSGPDTVTEFTWMGEELLRLTAVTGERWHHDLSRRNGLTYVLLEEVTADGWKMDGFATFGADGTRLQTWRLSDHWLPELPHPVWDTDVSHANSIHVRDGVALVSFRHLSAVVEVVADPQAVDVGAIRWWLGGASERWSGPTDFALVDGEGAAEDFAEQHHATWLPNGRLSLFDNRIGGDFSRALELEIDVGGGRAVVVRQHEVPRNCPFQGSSYPTGDDHTVLVCGPAQTAIEFAPDATEVWSAKGTCITGPTGVLPRMIPLATTTGSAD